MQSFKVGLGVDRFFNEKEGEYDIEEIGTFSGGVESFVWGSKGFHGNQTMDLDGRL